MLSAIEIKQRIGAHAVTLIQPGMTVGLGTGSTAEPFIKALAEKVKAGMKITCVPTSALSEKIAHSAGIDTISLNEVDGIDMTIDGADEIDSALQLIKGGGGALLQEKMVAAASRQLIIIADHTKLVKQLGKFPLPVEVIPYGWKQVRKRIVLQYNVDVVLRLKDDKTFITDHGNYILDCHFKQIANVPALDTALLAMPGVAGTGLFIGMTHTAIIGYPDGSVREIKASNLES